MKEHVERCLITTYPSEARYIRIRWNKTCECQLVIGTTSGHHSRDRLIAKKEDISGIRGLERRYMIGQIHKGPLAFDQSEPRKATRG
jgi:hypothetical protein